MTLLKTCDDLLGALLLGRQSLRLVLEFLLRDVELVHLLLVPRDGLLESFDLNIKASECCLLLLEPVLVLGNIGL